MGTGVIYNASLLTVEYLIYNIEKSVLQNEQDIKGIPQFQTSVEGVAFKGFYKKDKIMTVPQFQGQFQPIGHKEKPHFDIGDENLGKKKLSVRTKVGDFINYLIRDQVIEGRQDMCIKIKANLSYRLFDEKEIVRQFSEQNLQAFQVGGGGNQDSFKEEYLMQQIMEKYTRQQLYTYIQIGLKQSQEFYKEQIKIEIPIQINQVENKWRQKQANDYKSQFTYRFNKIIEDIKRLIAKCEHQKKQFTINQILDALQIQDEDIRYTLIQSILNENARTCKDDEQVWFQVLPIEKKLAYIKKIHEYWNQKCQLDFKFLKIASPYFENEQQYQSKAITCKEFQDKIIYKQSESYKLFYKKEQTERNFQRSISQKFIRTMDIIQGNLDDCYFLSPMAALANRYPQMIQSLFLLKQNLNHIYGVRLFFEGKWQKQILTLNFPINTKKELCGAHPNENIIWAILLQKAYAQLAKGYANINYGTNQQGMLLLTGAPSIIYQIKKEPCLKILERQQKNGSVLTTSIFTNQKQEIKKIELAGLTNKHSYSILKVFSDINNPFLILRNPRGKNASSQLNFSHTKRNQQSEINQKFKANPKANSKDGSFQISIQDFSKYFTDINISRVKKNYINSYIDLNLKEGIFTAIYFKIHKKGNYSFTANLLKRRENIYKKNILKMRCIWLFLLKDQGNKSKPMHSNCNFDWNTLQKDNDLEEGDYILLIKVGCMQEQKLDYRLSIYGPQEVTVKSDKNDESQLNQYIPNDDDKVEWQPFDKKSMRQVYKKIKFVRNQGYGFIKIINNQLLPFDMLINFNIYKNKAKYKDKIISLLSFDQLPAKLTIASGSTETFKFTAIPILNQFISFKGQFHGQKMICMS